jgi:hypothetical protein
VTPIVLASKRSAASYTSLTQWAGEHPQVGVIPAHIRNGPVFSGNVKNHCRFGYVLGIEFGLAGIDGVHHVGPLFVDGDFQPAAFLLCLLFHPFTGVDKIFLGHGHLVAELPVILDCIQQGCRRHALAVQNRAYRGDHYGNIDSKRAVQRAAATGSAVTIGDTGHLFQFRARDLPLFFVQLAKGVDELVGRGVLGIPIVRRYKKTAVGAIRAVGAQLQPGLEAAPL